MKHDRIYFSDDGSLLFVDKEEFRRYLDRLSDLQLGKTNRGCYTCYLTIPTEREDIEQFRDEYFRELKKMEGNL